VGDPDVSCGIGEVVGLPEEFLPRVEIDAQVTSGRFIQNHENLDTTPGVVLAPECAKAGFEALIWALMRYYH
jgi:hypothetical protein